MNQVLEEKFPGVMFGEYCKVYPNVTIGEGSRIEDFCVLGMPPRGRDPGDLPTEIGKNSIIRPFTTIYAGNRIGDRLQTGQGASIRENNVIGDDVSVGTHSVLEFENRIGNRVRIHSLCFLEMVTLEEDVFIAVHSNDVLVKSGNSTVYSRLVEGRFPRYQDVIPGHSEATIDLVVGPFYSAVRQAQIVTNEESRGVDFVFSKGLLTLKSQAADIGQSTIELPVPYEGEDLVITFDPQFIAEFLRILGSESSVKLDLIDAESAAVFRTEDSYIYVVMPLSKDR